MERAGPGGAAGGRGGASSRAGAGAREIRARFVALQEPARAGVTYARAAEAFVASAVDAYECGCSGSGLKKELEGAAVELPLRGPRPPGGADPGDGLTELLLVWLALEHSQSFRRVHRWAPGLGEQGGAEAGGGGRGRWTPASDRSGIRLCGVSSKRTSSRGWRGSIGKLSVWSRPAGGASLTTLPWPRSGAG